MNYKNSIEILKKIEMSKKILIGCHLHPDPDAIGSLLALSGVLKTLNKKVETICVSDIGKGYVFLEDYEDIKKEVNFKKYNFKDWDLLIALDSSTLGRLTGNTELKKLPIEIINIDHHHTNTKFGEINLIDSQISSTAEMLYLIFQDWNIDFGMQVAQSLLVGIIGDTGIFQHPNTTLQTFEIVKELIKKGANKDKIVFNLYRKYDLKTLGLWGEILKNMQMDEKGKFIWSAIPFVVYQKYGRSSEARRSAANSFLPLIEGSDFGIIMVEEEEKNINVDLRTRTGFDVSKIAILLGGGGHPQASGASVKGLEFNEAVKKILEAARSVVDEQKE